MSYLALYLLIICSKADCNCFQSFLAITGELQRAIALVGSISIFVPTWVVFDVRQNISHSDNAAILATLVESAVFLWSMC
jgi:hypothetical protein